MRVVSSYCEKDIIAKMEGKEKQAFDFVYNLYYEKLLFFARKFVVLETAEDILAETFIKFWQRNDRFESFAEVEQWLRLTLRNGCIDYIRKQSVTKIQSQVFQHLSAQQYEDLYFRSALEAELMSLIVGEIEKLPPLTGNILKLSFLKGFNVDEISRRLKVNRQVVYNKKSLGIKALRLSISAKDLALVILFVYGLSGR